jgi:thiamine-phosphate pyrophosphorylase
MKPHAIKGYYFITGGAFSRRGDLHDVRAAVLAGACAVQYRSKQEDSETMVRTALALKRLCQGILFLVNDRIDIALAVDADGVHIGQDDLPVSVARRILGKKKVIGVSVSTFRQAAEAVAEGADYLGVGPVYSTATKSDASKPTGVDLISKIKSRFDIPVVAVGGITLDNAPLVIASGADSVCAISAVVTKTNVNAQIRKFQALFSIAKR